MAASSSSFTLLSSTRHCSPSMDSISLLSQRFSTLQPWQRKLVRQTKVPAIFTLERRVARVRVSAAYTKRRMEAPGAYEVIDEETGERIIVWGGDDDDDDDSAVSTKHVLSRNPKIQEKTTVRNEDTSGGSEISSAGNLNASATSTNQKLSGGFGRLKVQKIRSLVRKSSKAKEVAEDHKYEEPDIDEIGDNDQTSAWDSEGVLIRGSRKVNGRSNWEPSGPRHGSKGELRGLKHAQKFSAGSDFFTRKVFKDLACSEFMVETLRSMGFVRPSHIQAMAYGPAVEGKSCIIADQSGSGKTLAYLAPVIQRLRQEEIDGTSKSSSKSPRAVVLVPTAELASQVLRNCRSISKHGVPFRSMVATGGFRQKTQLEGLDQELDVLIATPGRFMYLIKEGFLHLTNLRCAVLDEVDILFNDEDFEEALQCLINSSPVTAQYLFVTATLPVDIYNKLVEVFPDCEVIMGPGMHRTSSGLEEILVDCSGEEGSEKTPETAFTNKKLALLKLAEESPVSKTIVFCNKIEICRKVENALRRFDRKENQIRVLPFHAALDQETRQSSMKEFLSADRGHKSLFLICTDRASRGIDFPGVDHVVLFDFPRDPSEYVRRVGRTARGAGGRGKAFIFVVGKQVSLANRIIERNLKGHPLHEVPYAYELVR